MSARMSRLLVAVAVTCACLAHAGKPTFESVVKKFPAATLPFTLTTRGDEKVKLTRDEATALGIYADTSPQLAVLRESKLPVVPAPDAIAFSRDLRPIAAIQRKGHQLLFLAYDWEETGVNEQRTYLLSFDDKGTLLGGLLFHRDAGCAAWGAETNVSSINQGGAISRLINAKYPIYGNGIDETLKVAGEARARVTSSGALEVMPTAWKNRNGRYIDRKTKEELIYDKPVLYYRPSEGKPLRRLDGEGNSWRHKDVTRPWLLTWNDLRSELSVENSEGVVQLFTREY